MTRDWNGSLVMAEFAKNAVEGGLITTDFGKPVVGNSDKSPVGPYRNNPSVSGKDDTLSIDRNSKDYGIGKETGDDLVEKAHPEDAEIAESMGEGWLVENIVQQHRKDEEIATQMPSGSLHGKHAALVAALVALANDLEGAGRAEAAARVDRTIERLAGCRPFEESLRKEAFLGLPLGALTWAGLGAAAWNWFGTKLTSVRENLAEDIQDVIKASASAGGSDSLSGLAARLGALLAPYAAKFRRPMPVPGDKAGLARYDKDLDDFSSVFGEAAAIVEAMGAMPDPWYKFGLGAKSRLQEKFSDLRKTFDNTKAAVGRLSNVLQQAAAAKGRVPRTPVSEMQELLAEHGLEVPRTGVLDDATKDAIHKLEAKLDADFRRNPKLAEILKRRNWSIPGLLLKPEGTMADPQVARRLAALVG
jgi:hypothetical protein